MEHSTEREVILILADISGSTAKSLAWGLKKNMREFTIPRKTR